MAALSPSGLPVEGREARAPTAPVTRLIGASMARF
jgi:hypothetical protein